MPTFSTVSVHTGRSRNHSFDFVTTGHQSVEEALEELQESGTVYDHENGTHIESILAWVKETDGVQEVKLDGHVIPYDETQVRVVRMQEEGIRSTHGTKGPADISGELYADQFATMGKEETAVNGA